jgi:uncharacterized protein (DUF1778 family)
VQKKTAVLTVRVTPEVKRILKAAADRERRSQANLLECLVLEHCSASDSKRTVRARAETTRQAKGRSA